MVKVRLDRRATAISLLIALGVRRDGQKVVLAIRNMGGGSAASFQQFLDDLAVEAWPPIIIVDDSKDLEAETTAFWDDVPCSVVYIRPEESNLLAHAPKHLHDEIKAEFNDMMHASTAEDVLGKRKVFLATWRLRCRAVADSLEEAGERLFTFLRYPPKSNGARSGPQMPSSACTRSSNAGSRPNACCPVPRPPPCCSGRSSPRVRSPCDGSMAGPPSSAHPPILTSPPDPPHHAPRDPRRQFPPTSRYDPASANFAV